MGERVLPTELELVDVVTLYKKGKVSDPANYRPIALLSTLYKILASVIQCILADTIDESISNRQFGFRKKKSTSQPLFIARRLQDQAEQADDNLFLVFLDWEKAFDKIDKDMMVKALSRLGVPEKMQRMVAALYVDPQFRIRDREGKSTYRKQRAGIRQGCPLSPYLFVCLMTVISEDTRASLANNRREKLW